MNSTSPATLACRRISVGIRNGLVVFAGICCALSAHAQFSCKVSINGVLAYNDGSVNVLHSGRGDWTVVCALGRPYTQGLTVGPETCAVWYATMLRAKKNVQLLDFYFNGSGTCATINTYWTAPVPTYIGEAG